MTSGSSDRLPGGVSLAPALAERPFGFYLALARLYLYLGYRNNVGWLGRKLTGNGLVSIIPVLGSCLCEQDQTKNGDVISIKIMVRAVREPVQRGGGL